MSDIGYLAALLGGVLALLSPCSALLLPSFFAYAFASRGELLARTTVFYLGLATTLVPLGVASTAVSGLFYGHREALILIAGWVIIGLGTAQIFGRGFTFRPAVRLQQRMAGRGGWIPVFGLGAAYGLAGFCSGPILGAVLAIAATDGQPARGGALLAVYALGMAAPLFVLAALWQRYELSRRRWLRGRAFTLGRLHLHSTSTISGLLFIGIGVLFLLFDGTAALSGVLGLSATTDTQLTAQNAITRLSARVPDTAPLAGLAALIVLTTAWRLRRKTPAHPSTPTEPPAMPQRRPANTPEHQPQQAPDR
ncbi:MAG: cytochrome C biogenesis protein CcdA [Pseudonocardiales bacterium]|nr:MAG: cytochrome C biogenesis protein CcdA [Pseudonocardiales bacterium]